MHENAPKSNLYSNTGNQATKNSSQQLSIILNDMIYHFFIILESILRKENDHRLISHQKNQPLNQIMPVTKSHFKITKARTQ